MKRTRSLFLICFFILPFIAVLAQEGEKERGFWSAEVTTRYMQTSNKGSLEDFSILASYGRVGYHIKLRDWLKFGVSGNGLVHYGTGGIDKRDQTTGSGPIYETNLWNSRLMSGSTEFSLPEFYLDFKFDSHLIRVGRFIEDTPLINGEGWPFPNAIKGLWYKYSSVEGFNAEAGFIDRISSRFTGEFQNVGNTLGAGGIGVGTDGNSSQYRDVTESDYIAIVKLGYRFSSGLDLALWNYYTDNISNTIFTEAKFDLGSDKDWHISSQFIYQSKVGDGGNNSGVLQYKADESANGFGFMVKKDISKSAVSLAFTRIGDGGRLLLPREWGKEPFYTFQRRTRVEGFSDVTAVALKWESNYDKENYKLSMFSSLGYHSLPDPADASKSKYQVPSTAHLDGSIKYSPKNKLFGFSAELYLAGRFLAGETVSNPAYLINRADFFHSDLILSYIF
ncbi:hypothetical protein [Roseivirga echinicomitans]|uniref:hypothetical protein n=1 Tax=Roseivirga echinicomitans TaxID=296218 RepID=UPI00083942F4|nr:hypothetical protein [Roseivirga echinicomitans]